MSTENLALKEVQTSPPADTQDSYQQRLQKIESAGLHAALAGQTTYDALKNGANINPDKIAIQYMLRGDCFDEQNIPAPVSMAHEAMGNIACANRSITFSELFSSVNQCANFLHDLDINKDDVVSLLLPNFIENHIALWGAEAAGIANPVNPLLEAEVIRDILNAAGTKVIIALGNAPGNDIWQKVLKIKDQVPTLQKVLVLFGESNLDDGIINFERSLQNYPADHLTSERVIRSEDTASMFHTGGTTGTPKIALHSHANEVANAAMISSMVNIDQDDVILVGLPLFHVNAAIATGLTPLSLGATIILAGPGGFRSEQIVENFFNIIEHYKVTSFSAVPTALGALLNVESSHNDLSSLKYAFSGAAPIPVETFKKFQDKTGLKLLEAYGLTEGTCASSMTPFENRARIGSIGMRLPFSEVVVAILDDKDNFLRVAQTNEIGVLALRGPNVFSGYLEEKHNEKIWINIEGKNWLNSGDLGRQDEDGYLWLTGREKELIIRGGHNIDPKSIEEPLASMAGVELVAAVGRPDSYAGEVPVAYVTVSSDDINEQAVLEFAKQHIQERAAIPKAVYIIKHMPVTAVGKIFKPQLNWWQIESVIEVHVKELFNKSIINDCVINVEKHEKFGCLATVSLPKSSEPAAIEKLASVIDQYNFNYQIQVRD